MTTVNDSDRAFVASAAQLARRVNQPPRRSRRWLWVVAFVAFSWTTHHALTGSHPENPGWSGTTGALEWSSRGQP